MFKFRGKTYAFSFYLKCENCYYNAGPIVGDVINCLFWKNNDFSISKNHFCLFWADVRGNGEQKVDSHSDKRGNGDG